MPKPDIASTQTEFPTIHRASALDLPAHTRWLLPQRIPIGEITLIVGDPGVGKSLFTLDLAAHITTATPWPAHFYAPDARPFTPTPQPPAPPAPDAQPLSLHDRSLRDLQLRIARQERGVLLCATEDDILQVLLPRLRAAAADLNLVTLLCGIAGTPTGYAEQPLRLPDHYNLLLQAYDQAGQPQTLILDPLPAILSPGDCSAAALGVLARLAHDHHIAIIAVAHLRKAATPSALHRISGPLALAAAARSILLVERSPFDPELRTITHLKSTYGPLADPLAYRILPGPRIEWLDAPPQPTLPTAPRLEKTDALTRATHWLLAQLQPGPQPTNTILAAAQAAAISTRSLHRAKLLLNVRSIHDGPGDRWLWALPAVDQDCQKGV